MELDERMTEETKQYVGFFSQFADAVLKMEVGLLRQQFDLMDDQFNKDAKFDGLDITEHFIRNLDDGYEVPVTVYAPKNKTASTPIVLFTHGGGFKIFTRKSYYRPVAYVAEKTSTIWISVEYRLCPEFRHPTGLRDCVSVGKWLLDNKQELFGSDANALVGVCGDSAGGNLAANVAHEFRERLAFQILIYPWLDLTSDSDTYREFTAPCFILTPEAIKNGVFEYVRENDDPSTPSISPLFNSNFQGVPRAFVLNAELDPLRDDGRRYADKLNQANIPSEYRVVKGAIHGFFNAHPVYMKTFYEAAEHIIEFLNGLKSMSKI